MHFNFCHWFFFRRSKMFFLKTVEILSFQLCILQYFEREALLSGKCALYFTLLIHFVFIAQLNEIFLLFCRKMCNHDSTLKLRSCLSVNVAELKCAVRVSCCKKNIEAYNLFLIANVDPSIRVA